MKNTVQSIKNFFQAVASTVYMQTGCDVDAAQNSQKAAAASIKAAVKSLV